MGVQVSKELRSQRLQNSGSLPYEESKLIELSHGSTHYVRLGDVDRPGPVYVLIHDVLGSTADLVELGLYLGEIGQKKVICYDCYGRGFSSDDGHEQSVQLFSAQISEMLFALKEMNDVVLIGYGFGAAVALNYAATFADRVQGVVLLGPSIFGGEFKRYLSQSSSSFSMYTSLGRRAAVGRLLSQEPDMLYSWKNARCEQAVKYLKRLKRARGFDPALKRAMASTVKHLHRFTTGERDAVLLNRASHVQILSVFVKNDEIVPVQQTSVLRSMFPRARVVKFDDYFHSFPIEVPEIVGSEILGFDFLSNSPNTSDRLSDGGASELGRGMPSTGHYSNLKFDGNSLAVAVDVGFQDVA